LPSGLPLQDYAKPEASWRRVFDKYPTVFDMYQNKTIMLD